MELLIIYLVIAITVMILFFINDKDLLTDRFAYGTVLFYSFGWPAVLIIGLTDFFTFLIEYLNKKTKKNK